MLNSYANNSFKFDLNAVSGTLRKSHPKSQFVLTSLDFNRTYLFDPKPKYQNKDVVVLQTMLIGDNRGLVEIVYKSDFEED